MKPERVKGTRDFAPQQVFRRQYIFQTLRSIFQRFGYSPIETPALEALSTLTGQYGDEGDKLLFKIRSNRNILTTYKDKAAEITSVLKAITGHEYSFLAHESDKALRYDLTVPFARFVVMHRNEIALPFKRYQIQPVWRGDNPQHGRYCEFFQCDVDVVGSNSLLYEAELAQIYDQAFAALHIEVVIRLSNRKILEGLASYAGHPDLFMPITVIIDKLDKIGWDGVRQELAGIGINDDSFAKIKSVINAQTLDELRLLFADVPVGMQGIEELSMVMDFLDGYAFKNTLKLDFSLARGLSYYTGCIFEVVADTQAAGQEAVKMGSIGGGGRYDNLTGKFGWEGISGVGVSFGADRIYDVLEQLNRFPEYANTSIKVLFVSMGSKELNYAFKALHQVRQAGIDADIYPEAAKFKKQMEYADKIGVPYIAIVGSSEMETGIFSIKNMKTGEQQQLDMAGLIALLK